MTYKIVNFLDKTLVIPKGLVFTDGQTPWEILIDLEKVKNKLNVDYFKLEPPALSKYLPLLPITEGAKFISLQEMATPIVKSKMLGPALNVELSFKLEGKNPTGSFKDRGSAVEVSVAKALGAKAIILASTGNMAASVACYAARAQLPCYIIIPKDAPLNKLAQVMAYGGHLVQINGSYNDAAKLAEAMARKLDFYLAGDYVYRVEGQKTAAFELSDQLSWQVPDVIIIPIGCGTNITAYAKGFDEYYQLGLIDKIPQLIGVEAQGAATIVNSFKQKSYHITPVNKVETIASAIGVPNPIDGIKALHAIYSTKGLAVAVSDEDILTMQRALAMQESLFVESASAASVAAVKTLMAQAYSFANKKVLCVLTGEGLKDTSVVLKTAPPPFVIEPTETEFLRLYQNHLL